MDFFLNILFSICTKRDTISTSTFMPKGSTFMMGVMHILEAIVPIKQDLGGVTCRSRQVITVMTWGVTSKENVMTWGG